MSEKLNRIQELLVTKDVSQKELATHLGKSKNTISKICTNQQQPHIQDFKKIADFLDIDIRELIVGTKDNARLVYFKEEQAG